MQQNGMPNSLTEAFLEMLAASRGAALNSRVAYAADLDDFAGFIQKDPSVASAQEGENWLADLHQRGYAPRSIARKLSTLRQFFQFLYEEGHRSDNPATQWLSPKQPKSLPKLLTGAEIKALLDSLQVDESAPARRMHALIELLYATGLRVSELVSLPQASATRLLKRGEPLLLVKGKGGKERVVPVHPQAMATLMRYLVVRGVWVKQPAQEKWLFPSDGVQGYLTRQGFAQLLKQVAIDAGVDPARVSPHILRHSFASHLLEGGADLRVIQELLGHAHISTVEIYTHLQPGKLRKLVALHPLAKNALLAP